MALALAGERIATQEDSSAATAVEVLGLPALLREGAAWNRLLAQAAYPNPFYGHHVIGAHQSSGFAGPDLRIMAVRRGGELQAVLPFRPDAGRIGLRRCHLAWTHSVSINGTPLVHRNRVHATVAALLDGMASVPGTPLWRLPLVSLESEVGTALLAEARRRGWPVGTVSSFERAVFQRRADYETYAGGHLHPSRRKGLRRRARRLAELGHVAFECHTEPAALNTAVREFLALEAAGWKGARGTALASKKATAELGRQLFAIAPGASLISRTDLLRLDGRAIAISLSLVSGGTAFLLKTAHDESLRAYAPGLLLEQEIIRSFHAAGFAERLDSCSLAGCVLEEFFPDRERMADVVIAADPGLSEAKLARLVRQERQRLAVLEAGKRLYWKLVDSFSSARS